MDENMQRMPLARLKFEGSEELNYMYWDRTLNDPADRVRESMGLPQVTDVVRYAMHVVPDMVFDEVSTTSLHNQIDTMLSAPDSNKPSADISLQRVEMLDAYGSLLGRLTMRRLLISTVDIRKAEMAAEFCGFNLKDFSYRAANYFVSSELRSQ